MCQTFPYQGSLPEAASGAVAIVRALRDAGHEALLAGGCVRDLLLGRQPQDYDVATAALPDRVCELFKATRKVGVQFGVVLVRKHRRWIEVATFRSDGTYLDGRRPTSITPTDAEHDAQRRDFTVNGMFLDPLSMQIVDYVGGHADLQARCIRAIGQPVERFDEDYLRLLRAVRFAARLDFPIEPVTLDAIRDHAPTLAQVAAERVCDELRRMLSHPARRGAWQWLRDCALLPYLWPGATWSAAQFARTAVLLERLPDDAPFEAALACILGDRAGDEIERVARNLTLSNEQRETVAWLVLHQADLDTPAAPRLADFKRLLAHPAFPLLRMLAEARHADAGDADQRRVVLAERIGGVAPASIQPEPLVTGTDLIERDIQPGPVYRRVLDALYTRQLDEELVARDDALRALDDLLERDRRSEEV